MVGIGREISITASESHLRRDVFLSLKFNHDSFKLKSWGHHRTKKSTPKKGTRLMRFPKTIWNRDKIVTKISKNVVNIKCKFKGIKKATKNFSRSFFFGLFFSKVQISMFIRRYSSSYMSECKSIALRHVTSGLFHRDSSWIMFLLVVTAPFLSANTLWHSLHVLERCCQRLAGFFSQKQS